MKMNRILLVVLFLIYQISFGQTAGEKVLHGKIRVNSVYISGINVLNLVNEKTAVTNSDGEFFILAKANDVLVFTAVNLEIHRKLIEEEDLISEVLNIKMVSKVTELKEVVVNQHPEINARNLGIIPKNQKSYTAAERGKYSQPKGPLDALKIMITGKNPALDKALKVERSRALLNKLGTLFSDEYFNETLKIPNDYIKGFQYYCIEDDSVVAALKSKNKWRVMFLIVKLAENYNEIIADENE